MKFALIFFIMLTGHAFGQEWKSEADSLIANSEFTKARAVLDKQLAASPKDVDAIWRKSRLEVFVADELTDTHSKEAGYQKAYKLAQESIKLAPKVAAGHLRLATAAGKIALFKGILEAKDYVNQVKKSAEDAIALGDGGGEIQGWAYYVLGRTHLKLSETPAIIRRPIGLGWGNLGDADKNLTKAYSLLPNSVLVTVEIAKLNKKKENDAGYQSAIAKAKQLPIKDPTDKMGKKELLDL